MNTLFFLEATAASVVGSWRSMILLGQAHYGLAYLHFGLESIRKLPKMT